MQVNDTDIIAVNKYDYGVVAIIHDNANKTTTTIPHIVRHSQDGFGFGHIGRPAADLALSILQAVTNNPDQSIALHMSFMRDIIARMCGLHFILSVHFIREWIAQHVKNDTETPMMSLPPDFVDTDPDGDVGGEGLVPPDHPIIPVEEAVFNRASYAVESGMTLAEVEA